MSGSKNHFSAVISLAAEMGGSVKSVFGQAERETKKLGTALNGLYDKQNRTLAAKNQEKDWNRATNNAARLNLAAKRAQKDAVNDPSAKNIKNAERLKKSALAASVAAEKEFRAFEKLERELKRAGVDTQNLAKEQDRLGNAIEKAEKKMQRRERWGKVGSRAWKVGAGVAGAAAGVVGGAFAIAKHEADESREMLALSRGMNMAPEYLQTFRKMGKGVRVEAGMVDSILVKTTKSIEKAQKGKGKEYDALRTLRINVAGLRALKP